METRMYRTSSKSTVRVIVLTRERLKQESFCFQLFFGLIGFFFSYFCKTKWTLSLCVEIQQKKNCFQINVINILQLFLCKIF